MFHVCYFYFIFLFFFSIQGRRYCKNLERFLTTFEFNGVISKVRKTQHQNLEFGHTQNKIQKSLGIHQGVKLIKPSNLVVN
jgi:hypothetical protein